MQDTSASMSDSDLLHRYADSRDESAFRELVHRHLPLVYSTALRRCSGNTHLAEEIAQNVFTDLARKASRLSRHTSLVGWLHTSTRYAASVTFRSAHRRLLRETEALAMQENAPSPDLASAWSHLRPVIDATLDQLGARDRELILLRYFENQPFATLGKTHQLSEDAARKRTERALEKLRALLSRQGITSTSTALGLVLTSQAGAAVTAPAGLAATISSTVIAGAATGTATSLSLFLMAQSKLATATLITLASAATIGTAVLASNVAKQNDELTAISTQAASARTQLDLARQFAAARSALTDVSEKLSDTEAKIAALPARPRNAPISASALRSAKVDALLAEDPEYVRLKRQSTREWVISTYGDLLDELTLPPATLDALKEILVTERIDADLARSRARMAGASTASDETKAALRISTDTALRSLLGEQGREAVRHLQAIGPLDENLAAEFSAAGHRLSAKTQAQLARVIHDQLHAITVAAQPASFDANATALPADLTSAERAVLTQMGDSLTAPQRELLAAFFKFERERATFEQRVARKTP